jgi:hypothetical protein
MNIFFTKFFILLFILFNGGLGDVNYFKKFFFQVFNQVAKLIKKTLDSLFTVINTGNMADYFLLCSNVRNYNGISRFFDTIGLL